MEEMTRMRDYSHKTSVSARDPAGFAAALLSSGFSLHDCRASSIETAGDDLIFTFPDGLWMLPKDPDAPVCATDESVVIFHLGLRGTETPDVWYYQRTRRGELRRWLSFPDFVLLVNGGASFEFVTQYFNGSEALFRGALLRKKRRGVCECCLRMTLAGITFCWNRTDPARHW